MEAITKKQEKYFSIANEVCSKFSEEALLTWKKLVRKYLIEDASTEPMISLVANDNWVEFTIRYTVDYKKRRITKDQLFTRILTEISKAGDEIKFASTTVQLVDMPQMHVNVKDRKD